MRRLAKAYYHIREAHELIIQARSHVGVAEEEMRVDQELIEIREAIDRLAQAVQEKMRKLWKRMMQEAMEKCAEERIREIIEEEIERSRPKPLEVEVEVEDDEA